MRALKDDRGAFPRAANLGQRAADYLTIAAAAPHARALAARPLDDRDYVAIYFDRVEVGPNAVLVPIGVDDDGFTPRSQEAGRKDTETCPSRPMLLATESEMPMEAEWRQD